MRVGSDIEAVCGRCGEVWHVVIAVVGGKIAKLECKQCGARHRYRPVKGEAGAAPARRSRAATPSARRSRKQKDVVEADPSAPRRPFRTSETYRVGERVVHASFGEGVVQTVAGATKVEVLFAGGLKTLVHGRDPS